ncbi:MAG: nuclear transport factor 2 family protein [Dehalococcoidia bacterium]|nr:nuclear transport factor 2 family protein [Dehalococcoidia bacterium]
MSIEETRNLWEKFKAADQAHDAEAISAIYAEDVVFTAHRAPRGRETLKGLDADFCAAFPDYRREYLRRWSMTTPLPLCESRPPTPALGSASNRRGSDWTSPAVRS